MLLHKQILTLTSKSRIASIGLLNWFNLDFWFHFYPFVLVGLLLSPLSKVALKNTASSKPGMACILCSKVSIALVQSSSSGMSCKMLNLSLLPH